MSSVLHFHLAAERLTVSSITSTQSSILKFVKSWCTPGAVFHPDVLNLPFLPHLKQSAKLSYVLAVEQSVDPLIVELRYSVLANSPDVSPTVLNSLSARLELLTFTLLHSRTMHVMIYIVLMLIIGSQSLRHQLFKIN